MANSVPILRGKLQSDFDADGFTILNLDLTGLNLTKASVGLGNVDNTSDLAKPLSFATITALAGKEPTIPFGTNGQFWQGDKAWRTYGTLALQNGTTTIPLITVIGTSALGNSLIGARRHDFGSSFAATFIQQFGESAGGFALTTVSNNGAGTLVFSQTTTAVIKTDTAAPIIFGTSSTERMRIGDGVNIGNPSPPAGDGSLRVEKDCEAGNFIGDISQTSGLTASQIPKFLGSHEFQYIKIVPSGATPGMEGFIELAAADPPSMSSHPCVFSSTAGRFAVWHSGSVDKYFEFDNFRLTDKRAYQTPDGDGILTVQVDAPTTTTDPGELGMIAVDASYLYICRATDQWERIAWSAWP